MADVDDVLPEEEPAPAAQTGIAPIIENRFDVRWGAHGLEIGSPPLGALSDEEAMNLAAWLVKLTGQKQRFARIYYQIEKVIA